MIARHAFTTVVLIAAASAVAAATAGLLRDPEEPKVDRPWGKESEGFRSRIWLDKAPSGVDSSVKIHYEIQNASKKTQTVWHSGFWPNHRIDVKGPDGELAPMTEGGSRVRKAFDPEGPREKNAPFNLDPGETDDSWEVYDVRGLYSIAEKGTYTVQYVYQQGQMKPVESNLLKLVITGP